MEDVQTIATGFLIPEGPVALADGSVIVVEVAGDRVCRVAPDGTVDEIARPGGGPNGAAIGPDGLLYLCNNGGGYRGRMVDGRVTASYDKSLYVGGSIQTIDIATGACRTLYREGDGVPLLGPNDIVFDTEGGFWFTDLGRPAQTGGWTDGAIYYALPDGSRIMCARSGLTSPNGIGLSPDGSRLYWAETTTGRLCSAEIAGPGTLVGDHGPARTDEVIKALPDDQQLDSLALQADGRVCVGTLGRGGITIFAEDGRSEYLPLDDDLVTNICFGGDDMRTAWITAGYTGRLLRARWPDPGLKLAFNA